jgi:hypothetical protein
MGYVVGSWIDDDVWGGVVYPVQLIRTYVLLLQYYITSSAEDVLFTERIVDTYVRT